MNHKLNSILALVPQNTEGELVLKQALFFQQKFEMRLFVLNVIKAPSSFLPKTKSKIEKTLVDAKNSLIDFTKSVIQEELPHHIIPRVKMGATVSTLIDESKNGGYEFIIVEKSESSFEGHLSKAEIDRIVSKAHCPILTINKNFPTKQIKNIVIPIDISQCTKKRLLWAKLFAKTFGAKIQIVAALKADIAESQSLAFRNAEKIKQILIERDIDCEVKIIKASDQNYEKAILGFIRDEKPDMVIIRTHEETTFTGKKIGKFVSEIINKSEIPVFSVGKYNKDPLEGFA